MNYRAQTDSGCSNFYRVDLFEAGELTQIEFFESDELEAARERAATAVCNRLADRAAVRDDGDAVVLDIVALVKSNSIRQR